MEQKLLTISEKGPTTGWFYGNNYNPEFRLGNKNFIKVCFNFFLSTILVKYNQIEYIVRASEVLKKLNNNYQIIIFTVCKIKS
ncbi:Hypothetical protein CHV_j0002 [Cardinium endosymbiont cBtQ1 of Bemisia tabaci]|nr:Hypothetical protein CHV_j0002 [Cardinium endosymbiont cBtQ1 of Bemisia tabaci]